eukprot:4818280-Amphidinium_carterae.1
MEQPVRFRHFVEPSCPWHVAKAKECRDYQVSRDILKTVIPRKAFESCVGKGFNSHFPNTSNPESDASKFMGIFAAQRALSDPSALSSLLAAVHGRVDVVSPVMGSNAEPHRLRDTPHRLMHLISHREFD